MSQENGSAQAAGFHEPFAGFAQLFGGQATVAQALRPVPQYQGVSVVRAPVANSTYIDQPQILGISFNYDIAYGRTSQAGVMRKVFGGWTMSTFVDYASGFPIPISTVNTMSFIFNGGLRPTLTGQPLRAPQGSGGFDPNRDLFLNPAAFSQPGALQFGNAPVYLRIRAPATKNESLGVFKNVNLREWLRAQFRVEFSNPLNRVVFGAPITDFSAKNFGAVTSQANSPRQMQLGLKLLW